MEKLAIQSDMSNIVKVEDFVSRICSDKNINNYYATISMSVLQAVENAIIHGNNSDSTKIVTVISGECRGGVFLKSMMKDVDLIGKLMEKFRILVWQEKASF